MKRKIKIIPLLLSLLLLLSGCGSQEYIDVNAWKDKLVTTAQKQSEVIDQIKDSAQEIEKAGQEITEEGIRAAQDIYDILGSEKRHSSLDGIFEGLGGTITGLLKAWGEEGASSLDEVLNGQEGGKKEVRVEETGILEDAKNETNGRVAVTLCRVVDGDTLIVAYKEDQLRVRMIGINTPESVHADESKNTPEGKEASEFVKAFLAGTEYLWLSFDEDPEDDYERCLAYVWLNKTGEDVAKDMLNGYLLTTGHATVMTVAPNDRYKEQFEALQTAYQSK